MVGDSGVMKKRTKVEGDGRTDRYQTSVKVHNFNRLKNTSLVTVTSTTTDQLNRENQCNSR
jgi:hypothetical protein